MAYWNISLKFGILNYPCNYLFSSCNKRISPRYGSSQIIMIRLTVLWFVLKIIIKSSFYIAIMSVSWVSSLWRF